MGILDKIYREMYLDRMPDTEEYRAVREHTFVVWDKVEEHLGPFLTGEAWDAVVELHLEERSYDFKAGFRLGVQLALEAIMSPGDPKATR